MDTCDDADASPQSSSHSSIVLLGSSHVPNTQLPRVQQIPCLSELVASEEADATVVAEESALTLVVDAVDELAGQFGTHCPQPLLFSSHTSVPIGPPGQHSKPPRPQIVSSHPTQDETEEELSVEEIVELVIPHTALHAFMVGNGFTHAPKAQVPRSQQIPTGKLAVELACPQAAIHAAIVGNGLPHDPNIVQESASESQQIWFPADVVTADADDVVVADVVESSELSSDESVEESSDEDDVLTAHADVLQVLSVPQQPELQSSSSTHSTQL